MVNPDIEIKNCTFGEICTDAINSNFVHFYSVEYSFDPTMVRRRKKRSFHCLNFVNMRRFISEVIYTSIVS